MAKKYDIPNDEPQMVSEPEAAYAYTRDASPMKVAFTLDKGNIETAISAEELKQRSHAEIAKALARTPEEYEDMKAHDFYSKGTPFPEQAQTWNEVWKEVDNSEEEIYLDETESNKAMERLWSVLA